MSGYEKTTRSTTTTTHSLDIGGRPVLDDLRRFVEATVHLGAGTPVQTDLFGLTLAVHETRLNEEDDQ